MFKEILREKQREENQMKKMDGKTLVSLQELVLILMIQNYSFSVVGSGGQLEQTGTCGFRVNNVTAVAI